jgi:secreted trypsin-like serine protease
VTSPTKVAGGQTAAPGSQPWTASIRVRGSTKTFHWCGAAIIGEHHLLTAAHCVEDYPKDVYVVRVGDWDQASYSFLHRYLPLSMQLREKKALDALQMKGR